MRGTPEKGAASLVSVGRRRPHAGRQSTVSRAPPRRTTLRHGVATRFAGQNGGGIEDTTQWRLVEVSSPLGPDGAVTSSRTP